jgi:hypothetical protein
MTGGIIRCLSLAICLSVGWASAKQQEGERPSQGPRLEALMKYIQNTLNAVGRVTYVSHGHDGNNGHDWTNQFSDEASRMVANPSACRVNYHWKTTTDGRVVMDANVGFLLKDVQQIRGLTRLQYFNEQNLATGHPSWSAKVVPPVFVLVVQRPAHVENHFVFLDEELRNRTAKALTEAVELCGAGSKAGIQPAQR